MTHLDDRAVRPNGPAAPSAPARSLRLVTLTLAVACGATVANLYYSQPLLAEISRSFQVGQGWATAAVTATQIGYAVALFLVLPLGDLEDVRTLAPRMLAVTTVALILAGFAPSFGVFLAASVVVGATSVVAQLLVPVAANLAPPAQRGRFVGQVMSGLLIGILLARSVSSFAAAAWGWRSIYWISAGLMALVAVALARVLPAGAPEHETRYRELLASTLRLARAEPVLQRRAFGQALMFGTFSAYWTAIAYELVGAHHLDQAQIGGFALVGAAGAAAAPIAGRLGDRGLGRPARGAAIALGIAAMILAAVGSGSVLLLAAAGVLLDVAVQGHQVLSQRDIYALHGNARSRVNSVFMTTVFVGGAASSALTGWIHSAWGWPGVTGFGAALQVVALLNWAARRGVDRNRHPSDTIIDHGAARRVITGGDASVASDEGVP